MFRGSLGETFEKRGYNPQPICIGANTDPYQPIEARLNITRRLIETMQAYQHPFSMITKSHLIVRDLDILSTMARDNLCSVGVSVTTLDNDTKRVLEPRTPAGKTRLEAISRLADAGVQVTMLVAPVIPFINDHEIETILEAGRQAGARSARYIFLRLPMEVSPLFRQWLADHYPDRASRVMSAVQQSRGGNAYSAGFGERMRGKGIFADTIARRFEVTARKLGYEQERRFDLNRSLFRQLGNPQLDLFAVSPD